jgi:predicted lipid-binding transport protein (Tim44 family)
MKVAALITWLITALGGIYLLGTWLARGGLRQQRARTTHLPTPLIFGHGGLAASGLIVWIIYLAVGGTALAWTAFIILLPVALLGLTMFARWFGAYRVQAPRPAYAAAGTVPATEGMPVPEAPAVPAEQHFPIPVVVGHGLLAVTTLILVLITAMRIG